MQVIRQGQQAAENRKHLIALADEAIAKFGNGDWAALGIYTGSLDLVDNHPRLIRSLAWGDTDYAGHALSVMNSIIERSPANLQAVEEFMRKHHRHSEDTTNISTAPSKSRAISFNPSVFEVPEGGVDANLVAVMMPFSIEFEPVFHAIRGASFMAGMDAQRAKDIWQNATVIQDVFSLIFRAQIVVCDFTGKNANVFYEAGIAHTLGKNVVPITQHANDVPFDLTHHRYQLYLNNDQGLSTLTNNLTTRLATLR